MGDDKLMLVQPDWGEGLTLAISVIKSAFIDVFSLGNANQPDGK